jgi:hypothetical protein
MMNETHEMPRCKNTAYDHVIDIFYVKRYADYCLGCVNAGVPELKDEIEQLKTKLADCYDVLQAIAVSQPSTRPLYVTSALYPIVAAKALLKRHNQPVGDEA